MQLVFGQRERVVFNVDFRDVEKRRAAKFRRIEELEIPDRHRRPGEAEREFSDLRVHARLGANLVLKIKAENRIEREQQNDNQHDRQEEQPEKPFENPLHNRKSNRRVLRPHFEAFILVFPDDRRIKIQQLGREFTPRARQQTFGPFRRVFVGPVIIACLSALTVVPVRDGMDGFILLRPRAQFVADLGGNFIERHERFVAMLADQPRLAHVAREQGQKRRATARRFRVSRRRRGQPLEPDLPVVRQLRHQPVRADERMRKPPGPAFDLAERLRQPARERQIVPGLKCPAVFLPERVER